jgi:hypothetical protein
MDTQTPPEPPRPPIKLMSARKLIFMLCIIYGTAVYQCIHEYYTTGRLSGIMLFASAMAAVVGTVIVCLVGWYANKPEK